VPDAKGVARALVLAASRLVEPADRDLLEDRIVLQLPHLRQKGVEAEKWKALDHEGDAAAGRAVLQQFSLFLHGGLVETGNRSDSMTNMIEKLNEYAQKGIPNIWIFDPRLEKMFTFRSHILQEVEDIIATDDPRLELTRDEVFQK
jgi:hypothetical protein